jgi:hypothetical protein
MRRYKNKLFAILVSALAAISFASCVKDYDYEWREGTMDRYATINAASNGTIREILPIDFNYVDVDGYYTDIDDIQYYGGEMEIVSNDRVGIIRLSISNSNTYIDLDARMGGGSYRGKQVEDFLYAVVETVRRDGYATIYVDGDGYADRYARFDLNLYIDIDAYVRY